jgi:hypothetical protein
VKTSAMRVSWSTGRTRAERDVSTGGRTGGEGNTKVGKRETRPAEAATLQSARLHGRDAR